MLKRAIVLVCILISSACLYAENMARMLIFPLEESSPNNSTSWIGEGIASSISEQLKGVGLRVLSREERIELLERNDLPTIAELSRGSMIFIAQQAGADLAVMGSYQGPEQNIRISIWVLNLKSLKLGREMNTSGPLAALPQMENELAWMILSNTSLAGGMHREKFREATRKVTNLAYSNYIQGLNASSESEQIRLLEKALQNYPEFPSAHFQIGKLYYQNKDYSKALPHLVQASMIKDLLPQSLFFIGNCYLQENSYNLAIQTFSRNLTISRRADILNNLAVARYRSGDLAASVQDLVDAKNIERTDTTIAINLAILRFLMGNKAAALNAIVECLKYHPENGMLHFLYGYFLKAEGEKDKGMQEMSKANDMGIQVSALQQEKPQMWIRIFPGWIDTRPVSAPSLEH